MKHRGPEKRRSPDHQSRVRRLVMLLGLLQTGIPRNAKSLAAACGVGPRTIFRDLKVLREAGVPLHFDERRRQYTLSATYYLPPTNFTADEALAVMVLCGEASANGRLPLLAPAESAACKLASCLPLPIRRHVQQSAASIHIRPQPVNPLSGCESTYQQLVAALVGKRVVRIGYESFAEQDNIATLLSPYRLLFSRHSWYVIGRSSLHRGARTFNVGRIKSLDWTDAAYHVPRTFSLDKYLGNAWHLIPEDGPDRQVHVRFGKLVARNVAEVIWHKTQRCALRRDGALDFHLTVSGLNEISWWILGYGDQAEVLHPPELRRLVAERVQRMAACYLPRGAAGRIPGPHARPKQPRGAES